MRILRTGAGVTGSIYPSSLGNSKLILEKRLKEVNIMTTLKNPFSTCGASENIEDFTGYKQKYFIDNKKALLSIIYSEDLPDFEKQYTLIIEKCENISKMDDFRIQRKDGQLIFVRGYISIIDQLVNIQMTDVSEYYERLNANKTILNRYEKLLITINEGIWDWDVKTGDIFYSQRWYEILGYSREEIMPTYENLQKIIHPADLAQTIDAINKHFNNETPVFEHSYRMKRKDGIYIWVKDRGIKQLDGSGEIERMVGFLNDISEEKKTREHLEKMIITDEMTGLFNRRHYDSQINHEILRAERYGSELSILMIDIDLFKQINDTYGHRAGDIALKELSSVISDKIRNTDSAYRTGGEEFIVIATETDLESAMRAAERLRKAAGEIIVETKYGDFSFTVSLGVTTFTKGDTYFSLNEKADIALYKSKDSGRNCSTPYIAG